MIRIDKNTHEAGIAGTGAELLAELTIAMRLMYDSVEDFAKPALTNLLHDAVERAATSEETLREEIAKRAIKKLIRQLMEDDEDESKHPNIRR